MPVPCNTDLNGVDVVSITLVKKRYSTMTKACLPRSLFSYYRSSCQVDDGSRSPFRAHFEPQKDGRYRSGGQP